ncbi:MAG: hypothetical protein D4R45_07470 [Planctomycetaceae bacterium]|nr:MAG: hypothetical protein D4R45_07470 [Planctomycetaceae bacterium]
MAIISGDILSDVVAELSRRKVKLYHACQLADFKSYLQVGGIPSRNLLAGKELPYTAFDTDGRDVDNGVWRLVFFNLSDFGGGFAKGGNNLPNIYGPILLCFDPKVLEHANDISITLWSAGASGFDRELNGVAAEDVPRLFVDFNSPRVRFKDGLCCEFDNPKAKSPEMNCSFDNELAVMDYLAYIRVDPYRSDTSYLPDVVREIITQNDPSCRVFERDCLDGHTSRYRILWDAITRSASSGGDVLAVIRQDPLMSAWADHVRSQSTLSFQFGRYSKYLLNGTISECLS